MGMLTDIFTEWVKKENRWPLLLLLAIHGAFILSQNYFELSFRETAWHWSFWIVSGVVFIISGVLYCVIYLQGLRRRRLFIGGPLTFFGIVLIGGGLWQFMPSQLPEDRLVVAIAKFTPISPGADEEANNLPHRIEQELRDKQLKGAPIEIKRLSIQVEGTDEQARQEVAMSLGISRKGGSHMVLWGDVRKDEGELYVEPHLTIVRQLQKVPIEERKLKKYTSYEPEHINFKKRLSNEIADIVILVCGLAYYNAMDWDQAIQILDHVQSKEGYFYKGLCLDERAQQVVNPQQDLQAAIAAYEKIIGSGPWNLNIQTDPLIWTAYLNRASVLATLSITAQSKEAIDYLRQVIMAYENTLQIQPRTELPLYWAVQNNLVNALCELSARVECEEGNELLMKALEVNMDTLQDNTRSELPQQWAMTQNCLGYALCNLGIRIEGDKGNKLLREAVERHQAALQFHKRTNFFKEWATTQNNLGVALCELGIRLRDNEGMRNLKDALTCFDNALLFYNETHYQEDHRGILANKLKVIQIIESLSKPKPEVTP